MARSKGGAGLPFEKPILEVLERVEKLKKTHEAGKADLTQEIRDAEERARALTREIFGRLSPWRWLSIRSS